MKGGSLRYVGTVVEVLPSALFRVELEKGHQVVAHVPGHLRKNFVRLLVGDRVIVEIAPNDPARGRITRRVANGGGR